MVCKEKGDRNKGEGRVGRCAYVGPVKKKKIDKRAAPFIGPPHWPGRCSHWPQTRVR